LQIALAKDKKVMLTKNFEDKFVDKLQPGKWLSNLLLDFLSELLLPAAVASQKRVNSDDCTFLTFDFFNKVLEEM